MQSLIVVYVLYKLCSKFSAISKQKRLHKIHLNAVSNQPYCKFNSKCFLVLLLLRSPILNLHLFYS